MDVGDCRQDVEGDELISTSLSLNQAVTRSSASPRACTVSVQLLSQSIFTKWGEGNSSLFSMAAPQY